MPSTSAASVGGPEVHEVGRGDSQLCMATGRAVASVPITPTLAARSPRACGTKHSAGRGFVYPRPEDNPTLFGLVLQTPEDFLQFQIEEEMDETNPAEGMQWMSLNDAGDLKVDVGDEGEEDESRSRRRETVRMRKRRKRMRTRMIWIQPRRARCFSCRYAK